MKIFLKVLAVLLALVILAATGIWFWSRVINHRSFMAGFVDLFLTIQHRSDKFTTAETADEYIESMRQQNSEPFEVKKAKFGVSVREDRREDGFQAFIYNDQEHPKQTVFYFHGGAYVNQPNNQQLTMAARTANETGAEVVLMVYPKEPVWTCQDAYDACMEYYNKYIENNDCGKIVFMGDSAGGGLALGIVQQQIIDGDTTPEELILISPWVDASMSNKDLPEYAEKDPMLGIDGLRRMGEVWAGDLNMDDHRVSPIYGEMDLPCRVLITTGTWEVLYPDTQLLFEKLRAAGTDVEFITGERMIHCYPIVPVPEAKAAQFIIWADITR